MSASSARQLIDDILDALGARPRPGRRPLARRDVRALVRGRRHRADLPAGRDRRASRRPSRRPRTDATVAADGPRRRSSRPALAQPPPRLSTPARPRPRSSRGRRLTGLALIDALRLSARRPGNARTVTSLMHAIDHFRRPRAESVLTTRELAAIAITHDVHLGNRRARTSPPTAPGPRSTRSRRRRFTKCPAHTAPGSSTPSAARS